MESTKFANWNPPVTWVKIGNVYTALGCHCVVPEDDCGCEDCQERHGYNLVYDPIKQSLVQVSTLEQ
jgi:hypothetical protein